MVNKNELYYKKIISRILHWSGLNYLITKAGRKDALIITYHKIVDHDTLFDYVAKKEFEKQMVYLSKNYNVVSLESYVKSKGRMRNAVVITVDDGYKDFYDNAYPTLKRLKLPATIFVSTKNVNTTNMFWWDKIEEVSTSKNIKMFLADQQSFGLNDIFDYLKTKDEKYREEYANKLMKDNGIMEKNRIYLSWDELREIAKNNISIGGHTVNHPFLEKLTYKQQMKEIKDNRDKLNKNLKIKVDTFGYPYGSFNEESIKILKELKFLCGCSGTSGLNKQPIDEYKLKRITISCNDDITIFKVKMTGIFEVLREIIK